MTDSELNGLLVAASEILKTSTDSESTVWAEVVTLFGKILTTERLDLAQCRAERNELMKAKEAWSESLAEVRKQLDDIQSAHSEHVDRLNATIENMRQRTLANQTAQNELISNLQRRLQSEGSDA